jgi:deoxyribonuclease-4
MKLGFHISIARGFDRVVSQALDRRCRTIQLFSRNPRGWKFGPLDKSAIQTFRKELAQHDIAPVFVHMPYLVNLAASDPDLYSRSVASLEADLERSGFLGARYLIMHAGSNKDEKNGIALMIEGINRAFHRMDNGVMLLIENTAGCGNALGGSFEQLGEIINGVTARERIGIVLDTAHAFAAGYDLRTKKQVDDILGLFEQIIGLGRLRLVHFNDSRTELGSRHDRHWHVGKGRIGKGMSHIINHPALASVPFIMETPRASDRDDLMNMKKAKSLIRRRVPPAHLAY